MTPLDVCLTCPESRTVKNNGKVACAADPAQRDIMTIADAHACPKEKFPARGLGDVIAKATHAVGIPKCGGCAERQKLANKLVPFKKD